MNFRSTFWINARKVMMVILAMTFVFSMGKAFIPPTDRLPSGMKLPKGQLAWVSGGEGAVNPADLKGRALLINFWATWCEPCREELPVLIKLQERYGGDQFTILGVSEERPEKVKAFAERMGINYGLLRDPGGRFGSRFNVKNIPFSIFVNHEGRVVGDITGELDYDDGVERIEALLAQQSVVDE